ncbi:Protein kinase-like domain protein [Fonsecaea pedrosoi]|nr:Protein kinase-like domain protein [Fonsecaea pedrosoi]
MAAGDSSQLDTCDTLLDLDLGPEDCFYRLRRESHDETRVVYVHVTDISILPEDAVTSNDELIRALSKLSGWYDKWTTFTVSRLGGEVHCRQDHFRAHAIPREKVLIGYPHFDIVKLRALSYPKSRVTYVDIGSQKCYMKIARFEFEIPWILQELAAYHLLAKSNSTLGAELLGYVFEGSHRVIGFLMTALPGRPASPADVGACQNAVRQLHSLGVLHGDLVRYNILITGDGPKFIDFENSSVRSDHENDRWDDMTAQELDSLESTLLDPTDKGRPWEIAATNVPETGLIAASSA